MQPLKVTVVPVTPIQQNCSIVACTATNRAAIVDPGGDPQKTARMQGEALARIVSSFKEYDWDHAGMHAAEPYRLAFR